MLIPNAVKPQFYAFVGTISIWCKIWETSLLRTCGKCKIQEHRGVFLHIHKKKANMCTRYVFKEKGFCINAVSYFPFSCATGLTEMSLHNTHLPCCDLSSLCCPPATYKQHLRNWVYQNMGWRTHRPHNRTLIWEFTSPTSNWLTSHCMHNSTTDNLPTTQWK